MSESVLAEFFGGPLDGQIQQLEGNPTYYEIPIPRGWKDYLIGTYRRTDTRIGDACRYAWMGQPRSPLNRPSDW